MLFLNSVSQDLFVLGQTTDKVERTTDYCEIVNEHEYLEIDLLCYRTQRRNRCVQMLS